MDSLIELGLCEPKRKQLDHTTTERLILQHLHHPFLTALEFAFQTRDKLYLIMSYMPGGELFFWLKKHKRSPLTNEAMGTELVPAVQVKNMIRGMIKSGALTGEKTDEWLLGLLQGFWFGVGILEPIEVMAIVLLPFLFDNSCVAELRTKAKDLGLI